MMRNLNIWSCNIVQARASDAHHDSSGKAKAVELTDSMPFDHDVAPPEYDDFEPDAPLARSKGSKSSTLRKYLPLLAIIVLIAIAVLAVRYWTVGRFLESTDDAYIQADTVIVSPRVGGYVEEIYVEDNQVVAAGDPLFRIDPADYEARVASSQAQIDVAEASASGLRAQIAEQQAMVAQAQANLASANENLRFARQEELRYEPLAESGAVSRESLAQKRNARQQAQTALAAAQAQVASAHRRIGTLQAQIGQARAQAEGGEAERMAANNNLGDTLVRAVVDGRIGNKTLRVGQLAQPGTRAMTIVPVERVYVTANFKETQLADLRPGQRATIEVDALGGREIEGRVESFSPGTGAEFSLIPPENATGNFTKIVQRVPVRISFDLPEELRGILVPGLSVTATIDTSSRGAKETN